MSITRVDQIAAACMIALGVAIVWSGFGYGYMSGTTPGAGFFPVLVGIALIVLSTLNLVRSLAGREILDAGLDFPTVLKIAAVVLAMAAMIVATPFIGLLLSVAFFMVATGLIIRPSTDVRFLATLCICAIVVPAFITYAFGTWLNVPIPVGPFGF